MEFEAQTLRPFRIVPRLDIKQGHLIKGVQMEGWRKIGQPTDFAKRYYEDGADEILLMDVVASLYGRNSLHELIKTVCSDIFVPVIVGGGIRTVSDAYSVFEVGADKIAINTAAIAEPSFISELAKTFGNQAVVISLEVGFVNGKFQVLTDNGRNLTGFDPVSWVKKAEDLGAGEVLLSSIVRDGTGKGFDLELINMVCSAVSIPIVTGGGFGSNKHLDDLITQTDVSGMALAQALHLEKTTIQDIKQSVVNDSIFIR
jgi:cyclase